MNHPARSIRTFIGSRDFDESRTFYKDLGFEEAILSHNMSYFGIFGTLGFYLQDSYVKEWVDNSMMFLEVEDVEQHWRDIKTLGLEDKYKQVRITPIKQDTWGREYFLHDPAGILWHFGEFNK